MENLEIINQTIAAHRVIRGHVKLVGDAIPDKEALFNLSLQSPNWLPGLRRLTEKQQKLQQTLSALDEGLQNHFTFEERYLPPLLGELLTRTLQLDHRKIKDGISNTKSLVSGTDLTALSPEEVISRQSLIHQRINDLREMIENHARTEEIVLKWLKRTLEDKENSSR